MKRMIRSNVVDSAQVEREKPIPPSYGKDANQILNSLQNHPELGEGALSTFTRSIVEDFPPDEIRRTTMPDGLGLWVDLKRKPKPADGTYT